MQKLRISKLVLIAPLYLFTSHAGWTLPADTALTTKMMNDERAAHIGETLPRGIRVMLDDGTTTDLRDRLHGPVILIKAMPDDDLAALFAAIVDAKGKSLDALKANIALLLVNDPNHQALPVPASVATFHSKAVLGEGILEGQLFPSTFYFDKNLKLVGRQPGMPGNPAVLLYFPEP